MLRDETIQRVLKFRDDRNWRQFHTPKDLAISMSLEVAELLELFQWSGADLDEREPGDMESEEYEAWGDRHEELEDLADELMERLEELDG